MREFLTPNDRANEIKMLRSSFKGTFLLIEGSTDKVFYGRLINKSICTLFPISGKPSSKSLVVNVLQILEQSGVSGVLAIVDADFDHLEPLPASSSNLLRTDSHDLETDLQNRMTDQRNPSHDPWQVCCGHDLTEILSFALQKTIGSMKVDAIELERSLRLAYEAAYFHSTQLYQSIRLWESKNQPFNILQEPQST
jgi:Protein of unknown function (DUF4435)